MSHIPTKTNPGDPAMASIPIQRKPLPPTDPAVAGTSPLSGGPVAASTAMPVPTASQSQQNTPIAPHPFHYQAPLGQQLPTPQFPPDSLQHARNQGWVQQQPPHPNSIHSNNISGPNQPWAAQPSGQNRGPYAPPTSAQTQPQPPSYPTSPIPAAHMQHYQAQQQPPITNQEVQTKQGEWSYPVVQVVEKQPTPDKAMKFAAMTEEERAKQEKRDRQAAATKQCMGKTCVICGKMCKATAVMCSAVFCLLGCLMKCIPGDSPGFSGGGASIGVSMPN
ncbi:hypothetical protein QBC35DRAFT_505728 [Podospora australis]|uniref:Uncharacterized protein n=1 Tax=Podospora australis TaxID=1536484 RepID=A0AAN6WMG9_9PEZI|nr:hypothetical protein QBC35DRAFT_505728 [Podospora australis]